MNNTLKIILGLVITILVLMLSGVFDVAVSSLFNSIPQGLTRQVIIFIFLSILIYFFNKKGIIKFACNNQWNSIWIDSFWINHYRSKF